MRKIQWNQFQCSKEALQGRVADFQQALEEHKSSVGVPAPREEDLIEHLARSGEDFEIEAEPKPEPELTPEQLEARALEEKRLAALAAIERERVERALAARMAEPDAPQAVKDYAAALVVSPAKAV